MSTSAVRQRIAVCIPARDEAETIASVVKVSAELRAAGVVDEVLVVDDGSSDGTGTIARHAGAEVVRNTFGNGKGQAMRCALASTEADIVVFLDADVTNVAEHFVTALVAPLVADPRVMLVKAAYRRSLNGRVGEGGRVTEVLARPLLRRFVPELANLAQPLAGECAVRRTALEGITLAQGYGVEIGLLIDVFRKHGRHAIAEVNLGERVHRNRPLHDLGTHADDILDAVLDRFR